MSYAILRFAKLKTMGAVGGSSSHMARTRPTHNADPDVANVGLAGSVNPAADVEARLSVATERRKNSVLAIEVMASASPEWFATASLADRDEWVRRTHDWLVGQFGRENVAHLQLHLDETTPHITGMVVPVDPDSGRLNAARWLDGSAKLSAMQTGYAEAVAALGIERGLEGSDATHTTVRQFYGAIQAEVAKVTLPPVAVPPAMVREATRAEWAEAERERTKTALAPSVATLRAQARQGVVAERKAKSYQATAERFREAAQAARDIPLHELAERLGLDRDKTDKAKWVDPEARHAITLTDQRWFDHKAGVGGGGAIDLTKHVLDCDLPQAMSWLGHSVGPERTAAAVVARTVRKAEETVRQSMAARPPFQPPVACPAPSPQHRRVRDYLCRERGLSGSLVDRLMAEGVVYADSQSNAVMTALQADGKPGATELRGTGPRPFQGLARGSSRACSFELRTRSTAKTAPQLVLTESAIDAMSYLELHRRADLVVASTAGVRPTLPDGLARRVAAGEFSRVVVAYDDDAPGQAAAGKLMAALTAAGIPATQEKPTVGTDWNDQLRAAQTARADALAVQTAPNPIQAVEAATEAPGGPRTPR